MTFNFKQTRLSAVCQFVLGSLCVIFGTFDRIFMYKRYSGGVFHTEGVIAIWMGVWFLFTGIIGYFGSRPNQNTQRPHMGMIGTYMGFSIVGTVFAGVLIICYGIGIAIITEGRSCRERYEFVKCDNDYPYKCHYKSAQSECERSVGLGAMIIIFAVVEFGVSIWASVCCCSGSGGCCCDTSTPQTGQVVYLQTEGGAIAAYVMTQGPNGMPMAVPAMAGIPVNPVPNQAVGGQQYMLRQNQQAVTPIQYVQGAGGQVHVWNLPAAPTQQGVVTSGDQHPEVKTTDTSSEPPPAYMP